MKKLMCLFLAVCALTALSACGCDDGRDIDLVFINGSDMTITAVLVDLEDGSSMALNADSSPLKRTESFGFEVEGWPVKVVVYEDLEMKEELGAVAIREAPLEGERWYVTARDGGEGAIFTVDTSWPGDV